MALLYRLASESFSPNVRYAFVQELDWKFSNHCTKLYSGLYYLFLTNCFISQKYTFHLIQSIVYLNEPI